MCNYLWSQTNVFPGKESEIEVSKYKKRKLREQAEVVWQKAVGFWLSTQIYQTIMENTKTYHLYGV